MHAAKLAVRALLGLVFLILVLALAMLGIGGAAHYPEAWVFLAIFGGASLAITVDLIRNTAEEPGFG